MPELHVSTRSVWYLRSENQAPRVRSHVIAKTKTRRCAVPLMPPWVERRPRPHTEMKTPGSAAAVAVDARAVASG